MITFACLRSDSNHLSILSSGSISPLNDSPIRLSIIIAHSQLNPAKAARGIIAKVDTFPTEVPFA
jgi:hypothetical protein